MTNDTNISSERFFTTAISNAISDFECNKIDYLRLQDKLDYIAENAIGTKSCEIELIQAVADIARIMFNKCTAYIQPVYGACYTTTSGKSVGVCTENFKSWSICYIASLCGIDTGGKAYRGFRCNSDPAILQQELDEYAELKGWLKE